MPPARRKLDWVPPSVVCFVNLGWPAVFAMCINTWRVIREKQYEMKKQREFIMVGRRDGANETLMWKILENYTTEGVWIFKCTYLLCDF